MNVKKNFEKNNFRVLKSDAKVDATIIFAATINTAPTVYYLYLHFVTGEDKKSRCFFFFSGDTVV